MDREFFKNPTTDPDYSVSGFWFWNDEIIDEKTSEQLAMMHRIHLDQPIIHSRYGLQNEYLSRDWFDRIRHIIEDCKESGQKIWLYDENNWPSGNCSWTITMEEEYREHFLQFERITIKKGETYHVRPDKHSYLNITAFSTNGESMDLLASARRGEDIFRAEETVEIIAVYVEVDPYEPVGKFCVDYLSMEAIRQFITRTHEKYREEMGEYFGTIISGIFMDETRFCNAMPWTKRLPEEFRKRKGYDLIPYLPLLIRRDTLSDMVRYDYYDLISDLYTEATFGQVYDWCTQNHMKATGHFLGEETLATQSYFGADMMRGYRYFHVPGIDHLGNGIGSLDAKFASSACHHYGKKRIACEAFGASGWDMNFEDMIRISNWLFQNGINLIIMHGLYYSIRDERKDDFPPSYFYQWKYWDSMPIYVKMANRMMKMLSDGRHEAEILVYSPMETFWTCFEPDLEVKTGFWEDGPEIRDEKAKFIDHQFQLLCNRLTDRNLDYDILHSDAAENFRIEGKELVNELSGERYSIFILPFTSILTDTMVDLLNTFMEAGGIVCNLMSGDFKTVSKDGRHMRGETLPSLHMDAMIKVRRITDVISLCRENLWLPFEIVCGPDQLAHSKASYPSHLIDPYIHDGERLYGIGVTRYLKDDHRIFNITNYNEMDEELRIRIISKDPPEVYVPETGDIYTPTMFPIENGYEIELTAPKNRTLFIVGALNQS